MGASVKKMRITVTTMKTKHTRNVLYQVLLDYNVFLL